MQRQNTIDLDAIVSAYNQHFATDIITILEQFCLSAIDEQTFLLRFDNLSEKEMASLGRWAIKKFATEIKDEKWLHLDPKKRFLLGFMYRVGLGVKKSAVSKKIFLSLSDVENDIGAALAELYLGHMFYLNSPDIAYTHYQAAKAKGSIRAQSWMALLVNATNSSLIERCIKLLATKDLMIKEQFLHELVQRYKQPLPNGGSCLTFEDLAKEGSTQAVLTLAIHYKKTHPEIAARLYQLVAERKFNTLSTQAKSALMKLKTKHPTNHAILFNAAISLSITHPDNDLEIAFQKKFIDLFKKEFVTCKPHFFTDDRYTQFKWRLASNQQAAIMARMKFALIISNFLDINFPYELILKIMQIIVKDENVIKEIICSEQKAEKSIQERENYHVLLKQNGIKTTTPVRELGLFKLASKRGISYEFAEYRLQQHLKR